MRVVLQRVLRASVEVEGATVGSIGRGFLLLTGMAPGDRQDEIDWMARKIAGLRVFEDGEGKMNLPLAAVNGACLVVSQFTLFGDCRKGFRPGFTGAAPAAEAAAGVAGFVRALDALSVPVQTGRFQADMRVHLVNDGPVTLVLERTAGG